MDEIYQIIDQSNFEFLKTNNLLKKNSMYLIKNESLKVSDICILANEKYQFTFRDELQGNGNTLPNILHYFVITDEEYIPYPNCPLVNEEIIDYENYTSYKVAKGWLDEAGNTLLANQSPNCSKTYYLSYYRFHIRNHIDFFVTEIPENSDKITIGTYSIDANYKLYIKCDDNNYLIETNIEYLQTNNLHQHLITFRIDRKILSMSTSSSPRKEIKVYRDEACLDEIATKEIELDIHVSIQSGGD